MTNTLEVLVEVVAVPEVELQATNLALEDGVPRDFENFVLGTSFLQLLDTVFLQI